MISFVWLFLDEIIDDISVRRRLCGHFYATAELQPKNVHTGGPFQLLRQSQFVDQLLPRFVSYRCFDVAGKIKLLNYLLLRLLIWLMECHFELKQQEENNNGDYEESVDYSSQSQARTPLFNRNKSPPPSDDAAGVGGQSQGRFFFPNYVKLINSLLSGAPAITTTTTTTASTSVIISTLTIAAVKSCIPLGQFVKNSQTVSCRRRRNAEALDALEITSEHDIQPSKVEM